MLPVAKSQPRGLPGGGVSEGVRLPAETSVIWRQGCCGPGGGWRFLTGSF